MIRTRNLPDRSLSGLTSALHPALPSLKFLIHVPVSIRLFQGTSTILCWKSVEDLQFGFLCKCKVLVCGLVKVQVLLGQLT